MRTREPMIIIPQLETVGTFPGSNWERLTLSRFAVPAPTHQDGSVHPDATGGQQLPAGSRANPRKSRSSGSPPMLETDAAPMKPPESRFVISNEAESALASNVITQWYQIPSAYKLRPMCSTCSIPFNPLTRSVQIRSPSSRRAGCMWKKFVSGEPGPADISRLSSQSPK